MIDSIFLFAETKTMARNNSVDELSVSDMTYKINNAMDINKALDMLLSERYLTTHFMRSKIYNVILHKIVNEKRMSLSALKRILQTILIELTNSKFMFVLQVFKITFAVITKIKNGECSLSSLMHELGNGAFETFKTFRMCASLNNADSLKSQIVDLLQIYPDEIHVHISLYHKQEIFQLIETYIGPNNISTNNEVDGKIHNMVFDTLLRILNNMPIDKRKEFVEDGISVWFSCIVPYTLCTSSNHATVQKCIGVLELLIFHLVDIDYFENEKFQEMYLCVIDESRYAAILKSQIQQSTGYWHRIWCILVKLCKNYFTLVRDLTATQSIENPLNAMLSVLLMAFKIGTNNRYQAYICWNVLIDHFPVNVDETNSFNKLKVLTLPLNPNTPDTEMVTQIKFDVWWNFINKFFKYVNTDKSILRSFLQFCFGNPKDIVTVRIRATRFNAMKPLCVQAFVLIVAKGSFTDSLGVDLKKLNEPFLNITLFIEFLELWIHSLKNVTNILCDLYEKNDVAKGQLICIWKSFFEIVASLPDNNIRKDLLNELLNLLSWHLEENKTTITPIVVFDILLEIFFSSESKCKQMLQCTTREDIESGPINNVITLILNPICYNCYLSSDKNASIAKIKPITGTCLQMVKAPHEFVNWLLQKLVANDNNLIIWTAVTEQFYNMVDIIPTATITSILMWPLNKFEHFTDMSYAATVWYNMYVYSRPRFDGNSPFDDEILKLLLISSNRRNLHPLFTLHVLTAILKSIVMTSQVLSFFIPLRLLSSMFKNIGNHKSIKEVFPKLTDCFVLIMDKLTVTTHITVAKCTIVSLSSALKVILKEFEADNTDGYLLVSTEILLNNVIKLYNNNSYIHLKDLIVEDLIALSRVRQPTIKNIVLQILLHFFNTSESHEPLYKMLNENFGFNENKKNRDVVVKIEHDTNIDNKVDETGEDFLVVKSMWKFNPKKLTEHQKEELQRKRFDIPALYQDFTQSLDEFNMKSWIPGQRSDTQDQSSNSSKSLTTESRNEFTTVLKNIPNTSVVPSILDTILSQEATKETTDKLENIKCAENEPKDLVSEKSNIVANILHASKPISKSPRISLKDRVIENAKKLKNSQNEPVNLIGQSQSILNPSVALNIFPDKIIKNSTNRLENIKDTENETNDSVQEKSDLEPNIPLAEKKVSESPSMSLKNSVNENAKKNLPRKVYNNTVVLMDHSQSKSFQSKTNRSDITSSPYSKETGDRPSRVKRKPKKYEMDMIGLSPIEAKSKSSSKRKSRKSRLVSELAIDTVEGNPFLSGLPVAMSKVQTRRMGLNDKLNDSQGKVNSRESSFADKKTPQYNSKSETSQVPLIKDSDNKKISEANFSADNQKTCSYVTDDLQLSEDFIESSQESTVSIKQTKRGSLKNQYRHDYEIRHLPENNKQSKSMTEISQNILTNDDSNEQNNLSNHRGPNSDNIITNNILIPTIETNIQENYVDTQDIANADTQTVFIEKVNDSNEQNNLNNHSGPNSDNIITNNILIPTIETNIQENYVDTQDIANADTQTVYISIEEDTKSIEFEDTEDVLYSNSKVTLEKVNIETEDRDIVQLSSSRLSSPFKDQAQRDSEFLNNTLDISPIQLTSPERDDNKTYSPEKSDDCVVVKLSTPVQSNGEPIYEMDCSPEIFTEDKISPDERERSPPRELITANNTSPFLSMKKNRQQVRPSGRAAQMLDLCYVALSKDNKLDSGGHRKIIDTNIPAKRKLCPTDNSKSDNEIDSEEFLTLGRALPTVSKCSSILKRKLDDIADDGIISPASKKKRVGFHDPPVSTTISVQKYIGKGKKSKRVIFSPHNMLETMIPSSQKPICDMSNNLSTSCSGDIYTSSLDATPIIEVIKNSQLNDTDHICPELLDCTDPIEVIASELSSPTMRYLLIKEFMGNIVTIGDLAKLTELEVNRLCIKAPKVQVARRVLLDYLAKMSSSPTKEHRETVIEDDTTKQTSALNDNTEILSNENSKVQTDHNINEVRESCLQEKHNIVDKALQLLGSELKKIVNKIPVEDVEKVLPSLLVRVVLDQTIKQDPKCSPNVIEKELIETIKPTDLLQLCNSIQQQINNIGK